MIKIGRALLQLGLQNTHSGNISCRAGDEMWITKTGSLKGHLQERDIVNPGMDEFKTGIFQASSETGIHRKILRSSKATIHAHSLPATLLSYIYDSIHPVDFLGRRFIGSIPVAEFEYPVGSAEMEEEIPRLLSEVPVTIVKTHGPFVRGFSLSETFFLLNLADYSSEILLNMKLLGLEINHLPELNYPDVKDYSPAQNRSATDDETLISQFRRTMSDNFKLKLSPFHTGSLSVEDGSEMLYSPHASIPEYMNREIIRLKHGHSFKDYFKRLHAAVYRYSSAKSAIFTHSPFAVIQSFRALIRSEDRVIPIDAEGGYLYPAIPVVLPDEKVEVIVKKASRYKMVILSGMGALAIGHTPGHCIHHNSSLKNICYLKTRLQLMEKVNMVSDISKFLNKRGKDW